MSEPAEPWRRLVFRLARHLDNADQMPAGAWTLKAQELLVAVQQLAPDRFAREVRGKRRRGHEPKDVGAPPAP
jgi:hypothetical protein